MKNYFIIFLFSGFVNLFSQSVNFSSHTTVKYEFTFQPDSTMASSTRTEYMNLYIGENQSLFENSGWVRYDSIIAAGRKTRHFNFDALPNFAVTFSIYSQQGQITLADDFRTGRLKYNDHLDDLKWTIKNDTKRVGSILCQKAVTKYGGREFTAWFSTEVPFSEGPYKFKNLPGLVFEVYDSRNYFNFRLTEINKENKNISKDYSRFVMVPKSEYYKAKQNIINAANTRFNHKSNTTFNPIEK